MNVAYQKPASQSSTIDIYNASFANDGKCVGKSRSLFYLGFSYDTFSHTNSEISWWEVDLQETYNVSFINVFNRKAFPERILGFTISLYSPTRFTIIFENKNEKTKKNFFIFVSISFVNSKLGNSSQVVNRVYPPQFNIYMFIQLKFPKYNLFELVCLHRGLTIYNSEKWKFT